MKKAASEKRYIPWEYVFADASITARTAMRRGYVLAKDTLDEFKDTSLNTLYIDDFSRATRAAIETYRLARLMEKLEHRLIGVSDGFDLDSKNSQIMMMAVAMLNEMFIAGLRDKVLRGMKGAAERGTSLGLPPFGYKLIDKLDANGQSIITAKGTHLHVPAINEEQKEHVIRAAKWFADDKLSYKEIARRFNAAKVDGKNNWTGSRISKMLANPMYAGTRIYNRTRTIWDKETGEFSRKRKAWIGYINGDLVPLIDHASKILQTPDSDRWAFLSTRIWKFTISADVTLRKPPKYERHAARVQGPARRRRQCRDARLPVRHVAGFGNKVDPVRRDR